MFRFYLNLKQQNSKVGQVKCPLNFINKSSFVEFFVDSRPIASNITPDNHINH